jgi:hypothetical protein
MVDVLQNKNLNFTVSYQKTNKKKYTKMAELNTGDDGGKVVR